jgi:hypothetical protein
MADESSAPVHKGTAYILWCTSFLGLAGLHRFYLGKPISGFLYIFTFGFFGIGQLVDLLLIPAMVETQNRRQHLLPNSVSSKSSQPSLDVQILKICRHKNGATLSDCVIETEVDSSQVKATIHKLCVEGLLHIDNRETDGAVIYCAV